MQRLLRSSFFILLLQSHLSFAQEPLDLLQAIAITLQSQQNLKISELSIEFQRGVLQESAEPFDPTVEAVGTYLYSHDVQSVPDEIKTNLPAIEKRAEMVVRKKTRCGTEFIVGASSDFLSSPFAGPVPKVNSSRLSFEIDQPLLRDFLYGTQTMQERANALQVKVATLNYLQQMAQQVLQTTQRYWEVVAAKHLLKIRQDAEKTIEKLTLHTEELIEEEQLAKVDINQPLAELARQRIQTALAEQQLGTAILMLKLAMGQDFACNPCEPPPDWQLRDFPPLEDLSTLTCSLCPLLEQALTLRYDIQALQVQQQAIDLLLKGAYNRQLPRLDVFSGVARSDFYTRGSNDFSWDLDRGNPQTDWTIGLRFSTPLYNDGAKGVTRQLEAQKGQAIWRLQLLMDNVIEEIQEAFSSQVAITKALKQAEEAIKRNRTLVESENKKLQAGFSTLFILIDFENRLTEALVDRVDLYRQYAQNIARMHYLMGTLLCADVCLHHVCIGAVDRLPTLENRG